MIIRIYSLDGVLCLKGTQSSRVFTETENTWIDREELQRLDPDLLEWYESSRDTYSTGSSSLPPGENDEDISRRFQHVYRRRGRRSTARIQSLYL
ncbi:hypothetical protein M5K25_011512 [Dendrobium thyrsiflorum]|uniref:Uncharacterized protein n=1 Tax=Dendrobium thyrsiflorum TaxID=117978 RepID=A0ABD0V430_DENTH